MTSHIGETTERTEGDDTITRYLPSTKRGGKWVVLGLEEFRFPPLGFREIQELGSDVDSLRAVEGAPTAEQWKSVHTLVWAALCRNYPGMKLADVEERIDIGNWLPVINAVLSVSGYERREAAPGEK